METTCTSRTETLAARHGARYVALGASRGINVARNAAIDAASSDLLCFLDDDVEVWEGWLDALLTAASANAGHEALGGPIRARLEGGNLHACGREPLPITNLDLGPHDCDAEFLWGSNLAVRRSAIERVGAFDPDLGGAGDEEEWERRLRAAGGRLRYVAAAGVDHRRAGADARIGALSRACFARGRHARRWSERKGAAPSIAGELRTLAGCVWHTGRRRCGNGIVLTALTAGRLREALAPSPLPPTGPEYLSGARGRCRAARHCSAPHATSSRARVCCLPALARVAGAFRAAPSCAGGRRRASRTRATERSNSAGARPLAA